MGQPSLPHVTSRNQTGPWVRPANFARRSTFQPATTGDGTFAGPWIAKIDRGGALGRWALSPAAPARAPIDLARQRGQPWPVALKPRAQRSGPTSGNRRNRAPRTPAKASP